MLARIRKHPDRKFWIEKNLRLASLVNLPGDEGIVPPFLALLGRIKHLEKDCSRTFNKACKHLSQSVMINKVMGKIRAHWNLLAKAKRHLGICIRKRKPCLVDRHNRLAGGPSRWVSSSCTRSRSLETARRARVQQAGYLSQA